MCVCRDARTLRTVAKSACRAQKKKYTHAAASCSPVVVRRTMFKQPRTATRRTAQALRMLRTRLEGSGRRFMRFIVNAKRSLLSSTSQGRRCSVYTVQTVQ